MAAASAFRHRRDCAGVVRRLQHTRRGRAAGGRCAARGGILRQGLTVRLEQLYQEVILDHYKRPHHRGLREPYGAESFQVNPTCGDEVRLRVALSDDGEGITDVSYDGQGCSISQASTSVLTDQVIGQSVPDALATIAAFSEMVSSRGAVEGDED